MSGVTQAVAVLLSALLLVACSDKKSAHSTSSASTTSPGASSDAVAQDKATFSALIDGEPVSGGAIDDMQQQNAAYSIPNGNGAPPTLLFYLFDSKVPGDPNFRHSFRFQLPAQTGPASGANLTLNVILDPSHTAKYNTSTATITISNLTATRVSGTFSGKMTASPDTHNPPKQEVTITDGKFDIPMATSKLIPP